MSNLVILFALLAISFGQRNFITVEGTKLMDGTTEYTFLGTNLWWGANVAYELMLDPSKTRIDEELQLLSDLGIKNLRIMAGSQGPNTNRNQMRPNLEPSKGEWDLDMWDGLDYLLQKMGEHDMRAVVAMSNFWDWSGGFEQYLKWEGISTPDAYDFYSHSGAMDSYLNFVEHLVTKINSKTG